VPTPTVIAVSDETAPTAESDKKYVWILRCPCGDALKGATEDEIVEVSQAHLAAKHPDMADSYEREHILFMAVKYRDTGA